jgi:hypothetical protein
MGGPRARPLLQTTAKTAGISQYLSTPAAIGILDGLDAETASALIEAVAGAAAAVIAATGTVTAAVAGITDAVITGTVADAAGAVAGAAQAITQAATAITGPATGSTGPQGGDHDGEAPSGGHCPEIVFDRFHVVANGWWNMVRRWSASTPSTSMTPPMARGPRIRYCSLRAFPLSST